MVRGQDESSDGDEGPILSPEELDISTDEHVAEIDEGRYVVSPNEPIGDVPGRVGSDESTSDTDQAADETDQSQLPDRSSGADRSSPTGSTAGVGGTPESDLGA